ncbi:O-methyltransferase [Actinosynnema sp. CA-248983]
MQQTSALEQLLWDVYGHVRDGGAPVTEGFASLAEVEYLAGLARASGARTIAEIGFNIGFSSIAFLESAPDARVVSFELDQRRSVALAKEFVDVRYPGRHELVVGDSTGTVPAYSGARPDLVFVDGGHTFEIAYADIVNARRLARPGAVVVVDDVIPWYPWGLARTGRGRPPSRRGWWSRSSTTWTDAGSTRWQNPATGRGRPGGSPGRPGSFPGSPWPEVGR